MADIATVLKKTIDGLPANTPAVRQKVYDKARATILAKLQARDPKPSQTVIDKQMEQVEKVIAAVESDYGFREQIDSVFTDASSAEPGAPARPEPEPETGVNEAAPAPAQDAPAAEPEEEALSGDGEADAPVSRPQPVEMPGVHEDASGVADVPQQAPAAADVPAKAEAAEEQADARAVAPPDTDKDVARPDPQGAVAPPAAAVLVPSLPGKAETQKPETVRPETIRPAGGGYMDAEEDVPGRDRDSAAMPVPAARCQKAKKSGFKGLAIAIVVLLLLGAGGYAAWLNQDRIMALIPDDQGTQMAATEPPANEPEDAAQGGEDVAPPQAAPAVPSPGQASKPKFTQRLQPDGTEIDPGPAGGGTSLGEGTSVAQVTEPPRETAPVEPETATQAEQATPQRSGEPSVAVGQRAIFYEERTAVEQGTADQGNVVWSQVEESPGGDAPAEPAIRADVAFPERDLNLRITIRRNADETLPASHIIELVFVTPDNFPGGVIDDVLRITFKDNEQSPGTPLLGIPAKIADNFFLVALTDGEQEIAANLRLMGSRPWIDIPVIYRTGRRALITMEKGLSGESVFKDVIDTWTSAGEATGG